MDFNEALHYLDEHVNLEKTARIAFGSHGLSLGRMRHILDVLGDPQEHYPVIHLTGTNGKGSTAQMVAALLDAHQLSVGTYTSPHLEHITERLSRNLVPIDPAAFADVIAYLASLEPVLGERPSYFEILTAAAFSWFSQEAVDVAVVEVGLLGGRDATNVADGAVAVVTNIGRDHVSPEALAAGNDVWRRQVAEEKAGIIKPGSRLVLGETDGALRSTFASRGADQVWVRDEDFGCVADRLAMGGHVVDLRTPHGVISEIYLPVHGRHQVMNAACAVAAVEAFFDRALDREVVVEAFSRLRLPGRLEVVHRGPLLILDGAHNPDSAMALAATLAEEFDVLGRRRWVLGMLAGRDVDAVLDGYGIEAGDRVVACAPPSPRALPASDLAAAATARGAEVEVQPDVAAALEAEWATAQVAGFADLVIVTGSLCMVGAARTACRHLGLIR